MALAGRSTRRGGAGFRWLAAGVVVTLLVLLIDASLNSRSPAPVQQLAAGVWVDRVLPVIDSSTAEGQVIAGIWANGLKTPAPAIASQLDQVATQSARDYQAVVKLRPPPDLGGPSGLLEAALLARSKAAAHLQAVFTASLGSAATAPTPSSSTPSSSPSASSSTSVAGAAGSGSATTASPPTTAGLFGSTSVPTSTGPITTGPATTGPATTGPATTLPPVGAPPASQVPTVTQAGSEIQVGDQAYQLFAGSVPASVGVHMPPSVWGADMAPYAPQAAQVFLASLQSATVTSPLHQVRIYALTTTPSPVSTSGAVQVIPDTPYLTVTVVVADTGNQPEPNLTVTAAITPAGAGTSSVRDFLNLGVGQAYTIGGLGPLNPPKGVPVTLTVTVAGPAGSGLAPVSAGLTFALPAPPPPTTTTTAPPPGAAAPTSVPATSVPAG